MNVPIYSRAVRAVRAASRFDMHRFDLPWFDVPGFDTLIAAALLIWALPDVPWWWRGAHLPLGDPAVPGYLVLALAMSVPFRWLHRFPIPVFAVAVGVFATRVELGKDDTAALAAVLVAGYALAAYSETVRPVARRLGWAGLVVAVVVEQTNFDNRWAAVPVALLGAAMLTGDARRGESAATVEAAHLAERARIARELHDVLAHQLSAIAIQSGAARLAGPQWERARLVEVLGTVENLSREALAELSQLLGMLRRDADADQARRPAPGLGELDNLLATARIAGVPVELAVDGQVRQVTPGLELSIYRIVQEALTNVTRHAPGAPTRITLCYTEDRVLIDVVNGPPGTAARTGSTMAGVGVVRDLYGLSPAATVRCGIRGMRERAELYGGRFTAGPRPGGGFGVSAMLPVATREGP